MVQWFIVKVNVYVVSGSWEVIDDFGRNSCPKMLRWGGCVTSQETGVKWGTGDWRVVPTLCG